MTRFEWKRDLPSQSILFAMPRPGHCYLVGRGSTNGRSGWRVDYSDGLVAQTIWSHEPAWPAAGRPWKTRREAKLAAESHWRVSRGEINHDGRQEPALYVVI